MAPTSGELGHEVLDIVRDRYVKDPQYPEIEIVED